MVAKLNDIFFPAREPPATGLSVLFVADHFSYPDDVSHGLTTWCLETLPALVKMGVQVTACFLGGALTGADQLRVHGVQVHELKCSRWSLSAFSKVLRIARAGNFDVVHAAQMKGTLAGRIIGMLLRIPVVVHLHDDIMPAWPVRFMNRILSGRQDVGIIVSGALSECARIGYSIPRHRQRVVYSGLKLERIQTFRGQRRELRANLLGIADARPVLGVVGRFFCVKGQLSLIALLPRILKRCPEAVVVFVGDGPDRESCEALAKASGVYANTRFLGQRNDVPALLSSFDLLLIPSASEGLPLAAIEAQVAGIPVVAYDVGGIAEVVTDQLSGLLVPAGDGVRFAATVSDLIIDVARRRAMSAMALTDAQRFRVTTHVGNLMAIYSALTVKVRRVVSMRTNGAPGSTCRRDVARSTGK